MKKWKSEVKASTISTYRAIGEYNFQEISDNLQNPSFHIPPGLALCAISALQPSVHRLVPSIIKKLQAYVLNSESDSSSTACPRDPITLLESLPPTLLTKELYSEALVEKKNAKPVDSQYPKKTLDKVEEFVEKIYPLINVFFKNHPDIWRIMSSKREIRSDLMLKYLQSNGIINVISKTDMKKKHEEQKWIQGKPNTFRVVLEDNSTLWNRREPDAIKALKETPNSSIQRVFLDHVGELLYNETNGVLGWKSYQNPRQVFLENPEEVRHPTLSAFSTQMIETTEEKGNPRSKEDAYHWLITQLHLLGVRHADTVPGNLRWQPLTNESDMGRVTFYDSDAVERKVPAFFSDMTDDQKHLYILKGHSLASYKTA